MYVIITVQTSHFQLKPKIQIIGLKIIENMFIWTFCFIVTKDSIGGNKIKIILGLSGAIKLTGNP